MPSDLSEQIRNHLQEAGKINLLPLLVVIGPTASGKTALGIALAKKYNGEIISADSRQIYLEMDIGTAKPTKEEQSQARHHLIDFMKPDQSFTLSDYKALAGQTITQIANQNKLPILVGGTGLYINAVAHNYDLPDSKPDETLRRSLTQLATREGKEAVHKRLEELDPAAAAKIHPNNLRYVIRAIEIATHTQKPKSDRLAASLYHTFYIFIDWPRAELYARIEHRIDRQMEQGLLEETKALLEKYDPKLPALSSLGYQEIGDYLRGQATLEDALALFKKNTRNYAKRQLTWFRKIKPLYSVSGNGLSEIIDKL